MPPASPIPGPREGEVVRRARETERQRIAQLLHDTVSQSLTGTYLQAAVVAQKLQKSGSEAAGDVERLADMLHQIVLEMREIARQLTAEEGEAPESVKNH